MPAFPWDALGTAAAQARSHPDGIVDLSVGTPVDPVPSVIREALAAAADSPGYPATAGTPALRAAAAHWLARRHGVSVEPDAVLPVIGTKELVAGLPALLGCGPADVVVHLGARLPDLRRRRPAGWRPAQSPPMTSPRSGRNQSGWSG